MKQNIQLHHDEALNGLSKIKEGSIDAIVTDPPYNVGITSTGKKQAPMDFVLIAPFWKELFTQFRRVLKPGGYAYIFTDWRTIGFIQPISRQYLDQHNCLVWDKISIGPGTWYRPTFELILFYTNGKSKRRFGGNKKDVITSPRVNPSQKLHSAQKPVTLCQSLIKDATDEGDTVFDCFLGSGTTAVACVKEKRNFIGFEIDNTILTKAQNRVNCELGQTK